MVTASKPNEIGMKWRFFRFATIFKNVSIRNTAFSAFSTFIFIVFSIVFSVYPLTISRSDRSSEEKDITFFPFSEILKNTVSDIIPDDSALLLSSVLILIPIIVFIYCFHNPDHLLFLHPFLSQQLHSVLFPYNSIAFSYVVMHLIYGESSVLNKILKIAYFILFVVYLLIYMMLTYIDNNSIIRPNNITSEWFLGFTSLMPVLSLFNTFVSLHSICMETAIVYVLYIVLFIVNICAAAYCIVEIPMLSGLLNSMISAHYIVLLVDNFCSFLVITFNIDLPLYIVMLIPIVLALLFVVIRSITNRRRLAIQQFLDQFESTGGEFTVSAIATTLESLNSERQVRLLIYEGLQSGNKTVSSPAFVQFCLERFPESNWMLSYVSFIFSISWGTNPKVYKFMLHILSLDYFGIRNFQLFQAIYCLMQTAEQISPVVARELDEYRCEVVQFASIHRTFWRSVMHSDAARFHDAFFAFHAQKNRLLRELEIMEMKYPYCSSVQIEIALFYADMKHNFLKSSECYNRAVQLLNPKRTFIVNDIFYNFSMLFPICGITVEDVETNDTYADELRFISMLESHEHALRYMTMVSPNDEYLQALSHAFSVPTNRQPVEIQFDKTRTIIVKCTFIGALIAYIVCVIVLILFTKTFDSNRTRYYNYITLINETIDFRTNVQLARQDVYQISNVVLSTYEDILETSIYFNTTSSTWRSLVDGLYNLSLDHISMIEERLSEYMGVINELSDIVNVNFSTPECNATNCTLPFLFSELHHTLMYFEKTERIPGNKMTEVLQTLDKTADSLLLLSENVFTQLSIIHEQWINDISNQTILRAILLMIAVLILGALLITIHVFTMHTMKQNIFAVIKTIQPSILKSISSVFDKLLSLEQHQRQVPRDFTFVISVIGCSLSFFFILCGVGFILVISVKYDTDTQRTSKQLNAIQAYSNMTRFMTFTIGLLEHIVRNGTDDAAVLNTPSQDELSSMALDSPEGCVHYIYNTTCDNCYSKTSLYTDFSKVTIWAIIYMFILVSCITMIIFLFFGLKVIGLSSSVADIMKFVPQTARKSNPVLAKIMIGKQTPSAEVFDFGEDVRQPVDTFDYFCFLYLDQVENVIDIRGDVTKYIPFRPNHLRQIADYLIQNCKENPSAITAFFDAKKPLDTRSLAIDDEREISLTFSRKGTILLIKDDSHHHIYNSRLRMVKRLQSSIKDGANRRKPAQSPNACIAIFQTQDKSLRSAYIPKLESVGRVADTRFRRIVVITELEKAKELKAIADEMMMVSNTVKAVLDAGSSIAIFQSATTIEKSRIYGQSYDDARLQLEKIGDHELFVSPMFSTLLQ